MYDLITTQYNARIVSWGEPQDDLGGAVYSAILRGRLIVADTAALLLSELQALTQRPLLLMAA